MGDELLDMVRAATNEESLAKFLGNPVFKVLVLGTRKSDIFGGGMTTSLPLAARAPTARHAVNVGTTNGGPGLANR